MNKKKLVSALEAMSTQAHRSEEEQFFIRMLRQVWQIDCSVAPSEVWRNLLKQNEDYFSGFMDLDEGDDREEKWLLDSWSRSIEALIQKKTEANWKLKIVDTIDELNQLRLKLYK